jgi:hypothetical protein
MMTAKTRWTFAVLIPLLSCIFLYASASGANDDNGSAAASHHLNESQVALRYQAAGSVGVGAGVAKEPEGAVLETAAPNRASRSFSDQTAVVPSHKDIGEPTRIPVNATLPEKERLATRNDGGRSVVWANFEPSAWILGLALVAFVLYSRRRADN